jgi:diguanylate cyclase (GGDEF)-like protein
MVLIVIGFLTFAAVFYVVKLKIDSGQKDEIRTVTNLITQAIETTNQATETYEKLVDARLYVISKSIGEQLKGRQASTITNSELQAIKEQWSLHDLSIFMKKGDDFVITASTETREIGLNTHDWGYWNTAFQQMYRLEPVHVGIGYQDDYFWSGPLSKAIFSQEQFKYAYYYDGSTDFIINPYLSASDVLRFGEESGPSELIRNMLATLTDIKEIGVLNVEASLDKNTHQIIEIQKDSPVLYGALTTYLPGDRDILQRSLDGSVKESVMFKQYGKSYEKIYISLPAKRLLAIVMDVSGRDRMIWQLFLMMVIINVAAFASMFVFARKVNGRSLKLLDKIRRNAYYDTLTGLPNRNAFREHSEKTLTRMTAGTGYAMMMIDLDNFKNVNDTLGHAAGDRLLMEAASRLHRYLGDRGFLARMGGDEFTLLLPIRTEADAEAVAGELLATMHESFELEGRSFLLSMSLGISLFPQDADDAETLLKYADMALYKEKNKDKNNYAFFSPILQENAHQKVALQEAIRRSIEANEFVLHYQPQLNVRTGTVFGVEALVRWNHPSKGLLAPSEFIAIAEESGLIVPLGEWVLREACGFYRHLAEAGQEDMFISVNLSARQFKHIGLLETISGILEQTGMPPNRLILEITESVSMSDLDDTIRVLTELRSCGVQIAVDDFGTGYSSLGYLNRLPLDFLKIDCQFVRNMLVDMHSGVMVQSILDLGYNLRFGVIAEGAETQEHLDELKRRGCEIVQGWYISRPLPEEAVLDFIRTAKLDDSATA